MEPLRKRRRVSFGGKQVESALGAQVYGRRVRALNSSFATWALARLEAGRAIAEGARDYLAYAVELEAQFLTAHTDIASFGSGDCGQLAHGTDDDSQMIVSSPRLVSSLGSKKVTLVACGGLHNVACTASGECYTWGCNDDGSLGRSGDEQFPGLVALPEPVATVAAGATQSFAVGVGGSPYGWGCYKDREGKQWFDDVVVVGKSSSARRKQTSPMKIEGFPGKAVSISCGASHNAALLDDGRAVTWGIGEVGQLGRSVRPLKKDGSYDLAAVAADHLAPRVVARHGIISKVVACGANHLLIATEDQVLTSGLNNYGQLGDGTTVDRDALVEVLRGCCVVGLDGGEFHSLALAGDGTLYAWGRADSGQLGLGATATSAVGAHVDSPTAIAGVALALDDRFRAIACGDNHNLALTKKGVLYSWGYGEMCQLGTGKSKDETKPAKVDLDKASLGAGGGGGGGGAPVVTHVSAGGQHSILVAAAASF